jgi:hypothetical protein
MTSFGALSGGWALESLNFIPSSLNSQKIYEFYPKKNHSNGNKMFENKTQIYSN